MIGERQPVRGDLREREARFRALAVASREASIATDREGRITYINPAAEQVLGCSSASAAGSDAAVLLSDRLGASCGAAFERFRSRGSGLGARTLEPSEAGMAAGGLQLQLTLGAFEHGGTRFFTIILHDIARRTRAERDLAHRDTQLAEAQELARLGTFESDVSADVISCSPELYRIYGLDPDEVKPSWETFLARVHPEDVARVRADVNRALWSRRPVSILHCIVRGDGEVRELHTRVKVVEDEGMPGGARVIGMCQDVTEQRREAEERREAHERFRLAFENAPIGMALTAVDGRWLQVNRALCEIAGYTEEALLAGVSQDITHPEDLPRAIECAKRLLRGDARSCQIELRYVHREGHAVEVRQSMSLVRDVERQPRYFIAQIEDITERRQTKDALQESRERLQAILDNTRAGLYLKDLDGRYLMANAEIAAICGRKPDELAGKTDWEVFPEELAARFAQDDRTVIESQAPLEFEESIPRPDGPRTYISQKFPLRDPQGAPYAIGCISTDITERVRVEEENRRLEAELHQTQRLETVGRLAGGIAHDFNNLMAVILNYAALLEQDLAGASELVEEAAEIRKAAEHAAALTQRLVAFSSGEVVEPHVLDLNAVVEDADKLLRVTIGEGLELTTCLAPELWPVEADLDQLQRVLLNLVVNARDAMPRGGSLLIRTGNVVVDSEQAERFPEAIDPGRYVCLSVHDTGCGMTREVASRAFDPFYTTKCRKEGRGLGLATVYGVVRQAGGRVELHSEPGVGTTVRVYLPVTEREPGRSREPLAGEPSVGHGETVLVVEDDDAVRTLVCRVLARNRYRVLDAARPKEAIRLLDSGIDRVALLICDVVMPRMSGPELAERLCALQPDLKVLFMSGYTDEVVLGLSDAGTPVLKKPFTVAGLLSSVDHALASVPQT